MIKGRFYKAVSSTAPGSKLDYAFLFSNLSIVLGVVVSLLTLGVMNGIENSIFSNISIVESDYFFSIESEDDDLIHLLNANDYHYSFRSNQEIALVHGTEYRLVNSISYSDFNSIIENDYAMLTNSIINNTDLVSIGLGADLAFNLNVKLGDTLKIFSPSNIDIGLNSIKATNVVVNHIFDINVLDYNYNLAIFPINLNGKLFDNYNGIIGIEENAYKGVKSRLEDIVVKESVANSALFKALRIEKYLYTSFGLILVFVSCLSIYSSIQININRNRKEFALLNAIGYKRSIMKYDILKFVFLNSTISTIFALMCVVLFKYIDDYFLVSNMLIPKGLGINISISIGLFDSVIMTLIVNIVTLFSAYSSLSIIDNINPSVELKT